MYVRIRAHYWKAVLYIAKGILYNYTSTYTSLGIQIECLNYIKEVSESIPF